LKPVWSIGQTIARDSTERARMPIDYEVDEVKNVVYATGRGAVADEDFLDYVRRFLADARIRPGYRELVDLTAATKGAISPGLFDLIAELDRQQPKQQHGSRTAIVVTDNESFHLASQYGLKAQAPVIVFSNASVARTWLGI
jgi:hypothetical protein